MFTETFDLPIFIEVAVPVPIDNNVPDESKDEPIIEFVPIDKLLVAVPIHPNTIEFHVDRNRC